MVTRVMGPGQRLRRLTLDLGVRSFMGLDQQTGMIRQDLLASSAPASGLSGSYGEPVSVDPDNL